MGEIKKNSVYERIHKHLFDTKDKTKLSEFEYGVKQRVQAAFIKKLENPTIRDKDIVQYLMKEFGISMSVAYTDINAAEVIHGNVRKANKDYVRMVVTENLKYIIETEKDRIAADPENKYPTKDYITAISILSKAHNLDKEAPDLPNWNELQPPNIEPTNDVTILDLEMIDDEGIKKLRQKYLKATGAKDDE
jgi:hypothetical protein